MHAPRHRRSTNGEREIEMLNNDEDEYGGRRLEWYSCFRFVAVADDTSEEVFLYYHQFGIRDDGDDDDGDNRRPPTPPDPAHSGYALST